MVPTHEQGSQLGEGGGGTTVFSLRDILLGKILSVKLGQARLLRKCQWPEGKTRVWVR